MSKPIIFFYILIGEYNNKSTNLIYKVKFSFQYLLFYPNRTTKLVYLICNIRTLTQLSNFVIVEREKKEKKQVRVTYYHYYLALPCYQRLLVAVLLSLLLQLCCYWAMAERECCWTSMMAMSLSWSLSSCCCCFALVCLRFGRHDGVRCRLDCLFRWCGSLGD